MDRPRVEAVLAAHRSTVTALTVHLSGLGRARSTRATAEGSCRTTFIRQRWPYDVGQNGCLRPFPQTLPTVVACAAAASFDPRGGSVDAGPAWTAAGAAGTGGPQQSTSPSRPDGRGGRGRRPAAVSRRVDRAGVERARHRQRLGPAVRMGP